MFVCMRMLCYSITLLMVMLCSGYVISAITKKHCVVALFLPSGKDVADQLNFYLMGLKQLSPMVTKFSF